MCVANISPVFLLVFYELYLCDFLAKQKSYIFIKLNVCLLYFWLVVSALLRKKFHFKIIYLKSSHMFYFNSLIALYFTWNSVLNLFWNKAGVETYFPLQMVSELNQHHLWNNHPCSQILSFKNTSIFFVLFLDSLIYYIVQ